jgi:hypothetical protein
MVHRGREVAGRCLCRCCRERPAQRGHVRADRAGGVAKGACLRDPQRHKHVLCRLAKEDGRAVAARPPDSQADLGRWAGTRHEWPSRGSGATDAQAVLGPTGARLGSRAAAGAWARRQWRSSVAVAARRPRARRPATARGTRKCECTRVRCGPAAPAAPALCVRHTDAHAHTGQAMGAGTLTTLPSHRCRAQARHRVIQTWAGSETKTPGPVPHAHSL